MKAINNKRAKLIFNQLKTAQCDRNISELIKMLFVTEPSVIEKSICKHCPNGDPVGFPLIVLNDRVFANKLSNLEEAITENFPETLTCRNCKAKAVCQREFGPHMFIEVIMIIKISSEIHLNFVDNLIIKFN